MSTDFDPTPGVGIQQFMKEHGLSIPNVATLLGEFQVHDHDLHTWISAGQQSAAAALCLHELTQIPEARIQEIIAATPKPEPKIQKGAGLASAKPAPTKKPESKSHAKVKPAKETQTAKLRRLAERQSKPDKKGPNGTC